jgi:hypothetical protein
MPKITRVVDRGPLGAKQSLAAAEAFFAERRARADLGAFRRLLKRRGGEKPRAGDEKSSARSG